MTFGHSVTATVPDAFFSAVSRALPLPPPAWVRISTTSGAGSAAYRDDLVGDVLARVLRGPDHHHTAAAEQRRRGQRGQLADGQATPGHVVHVATRSRVGGRGFPGPGQQRGDGAFDEQLFLADDEVDRSRGHAGQDIAAQTLPGMTGSPPRQMRYGLRP